MLQTSRSTSISEAAVPCFPWYAIRTKSNCERTVATAFSAKGYESYLPSIRRARQQRTRVVQMEAPLFAGYVFCRFDVTRRLPVLQTPGVVSIVGFGNEPAPVSDAEIFAVQTTLQSGLAAEPCPFLQEGDRVAITEGALAGVEGILLKKKTEWRLVVSVTLLQRSLSVEVDRDSIRTIDQA